MAIRKGFIEVNGLETQVLTVGGWIEDTNVTKHVILCIPGNPCGTYVYRRFMETIHSRVGVPVWILSHAGQELPWDSREKLEDNLDNYSLDGQTRHKVAFIKKYIPADVKLTLIGHSIGCKLVLDALKTSDIHKQVDKCYLLFPTIERLAASPKGKFLIKKVKPVVFLLVFASWIFSIPPFIIRKTLIRVFLYLLRSPNFVFAGDYVRDLGSKNITNAFYFAFDEMDTVKALDKGTIETFSDKLVFYYGVNDGWVPSDCCQTMKNTFPNVDVIECEKGFHHSFIGSACVEMGSWVADKIQGH